MKKTITYKQVFITIFSAFITYLLTNTISENCYFGIAFYISLLYLGLNPFIASFSFICGILPTMNWEIILPSLICIIVNVLIFSIHKKRQKKVGGEIIFYSILSHIPFILIYPENFTIMLSSMASSIIAVFIFISSSRVLFIKKLDYKVHSDELFCLSIFAILLELGIINVFGVNVLKSINIFLILIIGLLFGGSKSVLSSIVLSLAPSLYSLTITPIATYSMLAFASSLFINSYKILPAFCLLVQDVFFMIVLKIYGTFVYTDVFYTIIPIALFLFLPNKLLESLTKKTSTFQNKILTKYAINRMRASISAKLYGVSDVFSEMQQSFVKLKECVSTDADLLNRMADEIVLNVCESCPSYLRCKQSNEPKRSELIKILSVGIAKNRVSLIDLTKNFTENCSYVNGVIFEMNALIGKYKEKVRESEDVLNGKELIKMQSEGVAGVLKGMALDFSKNLAYQVEKEVELTDLLHKKGIMFNEIMVLGEEDNYEINLVLKNQVIGNENLLLAINEGTNRINNIVSKTAISQTTSAITIRKSPVIDAAFGLAVSTKSGSISSGDTHTLTKIDEGKFLIALSDGMGSGDRAKNTSSTAISLIESFYKAGLDSKLILSMVNKVLALNTDDNFSAMDIVSVNLFTLNVDFIKIGAPYSFILTDESIKIIEGASLPLGILEDLTPTGCSSILKEGNTIVMFTDGISDAFSSSTDLIDFLRTIENRNPQQVADSLLKRAIELEGDNAKDDMTVLAIRLFKKVS